MKSKWGLKDTIYIGDETRDVEAGKKVRVKTIAVTWGFEAETILKKASPGFIVSKPGELLEVIQNLSKK